MKLCCFNYILIPTHFFFSKVSLIIKLSFQSRGKIMIPDPGLGRKKDWKKKRNEGKEEKRFEEWLRKKLIFSLLPIFSLNQIFSILTSCYSVIGLTCCVTWSFKERNQPSITSYIIIHDSSLLSIPLQVLSFLSFSLPPFSPLYMLSSLNP